MTDREPSPGDVLGGRYELLGLLGRGGMATVYRGRDLRLQRTVAVKVFRAGFAEAMDPARITHEMQLLGGFDHPSVVGVLDASTGDGVFGAHLVMEYVAGDDLGAMLHAARGPLAADFARRIVADVAEALQALHDRGVVHRDVKPGNILVPKRGGTSRVTAKLTDFGIAQMVDDGGMAGAESILGTAAYLSPEQVRGSAPRPASDVYSLGLVLLEALTGRRAFPGPATESAMARLHRRPTLPDDASPALADLLSRMTALDPLQRPTAGEVATALRTELVGRVTRPEAAHTAPTPIAGIAPVLTRAEVDAGATAPHASVTGSWHTGTVTTTGWRAPASAPRRRRFPTVLVVTASALAAAVAAVAISAAAGTVAVQPSPAATGSHVAKAVASGPAQAAKVVPISPTPSVSPHPTRHTTPTPTPTTSRASATPHPTSSAAPDPGLVAPTAPVVPVAPVVSSPPASPAPSDSPTPTPTDTASDPATDGSSTLVTGVDDPPD